MDLKHAILKGSNLFDFSVATDLAVLISCSVVFTVTAGLIFERKK